VEAGEAAPGAGLKEEEPEMRPCSRTDYARARRRVHELGYPVGSDKWKVFWAGSVAWAAGKSEADCPIPEVTEEERRAGKRAPHRRGAWLQGFRAGEGTPKTLCRCQRRTA